MGPILPSSRRAAGRAPMAEINVTPLVDVMLVLLIIFMVTAPLLVAGVQSTCPKAGRALEQGPSRSRSPSTNRAGMFIDDRRAPTGEASAPQRLATGRARPSPRGPPDLPARRPRPRLRPGHAGDGRAQPRRPQPRRAGLGRRGAVVMMTGPNGLAPVPRSRFPRRADRGAVDEPGRRPRPNRRRWRSSSSRRSALDRRARPVGRHPSAAGPEPPRSARPPQEPPLEAAPAPSRRPARNRRCPSRDAGQARSAAKAGRPGREREHGDDFL